LKGTLVVLIFLVILRLYADASVLVVGAVFLVAAVGTGRVTATLRPQLWSLLAMAILCRWLLAGHRRWWLIAFPSLFMLWVNLHGGWIVGAGVLAIWSAFQMTRPDAPRGLIVAIAVLSAVA